MMHGGVASCLPMPFALPRYSGVVELRQNIHRLLKSTPLSLSRCNSAYVHIHMLHLCFTPASSFLLHLYSCFTRTLLVLFLRCVCVRHEVLQQRAAGEAAVYEPPHVCVLMHVGAAQARTRLQERQRVSHAAQVRDACHMMPAFTI